MPKLNPNQVAAAQAQGYEEKSEELKPLPIADGKPYVYKLVGCTSGPAKSNPSKIQWTWEMTLDGLYHPEFVGKGYLERIWHYTPVDGGQEWAIAKMLHAFGYSPDTDTDELINDEATVLAFLTLDSYGTPPKVTMKARRFAYHDETEFPPAQGTEPPFGGADDPNVPAQAYASVAAAQQAPSAVAVTAPADDPWAKAPETPAAASVPPQAQADENDTF
jgi:hypothetical protein